MMRDLRVWCWKRVTFWVFVLPVFLASCSEDDGGVRPNLSDVETSDAPVEGGFVAREIPEDVSVRNVERSVVDVPREGEAAFGFRCRVHVVDDGHRSVPRVPTRLVLKRLVDGEWLVLRELASTDSDDDGKAGFDVSPWEVTSLSSVTGLFVEAGPEGMSSDVRWTEFEDVHPLILPLAATGTLSLRAVDALGRAVDLTWVTVEFRDRDTGEIAWTTGVRLARGVPCDVPCTLGWNVHVYSADKRAGPSKGITLDLAGPHVAGERCEAVLRLPQAVPLLVGILLGDDGAPWRTSRCDVSVEWEDVEISDHEFLGFHESLACHATLTTDDAGRFETTLPFRAAWRSGGLLSITTPSEESMDAWNESAIQRVSTRLGSLGPRSVIDVGTLRLRRPVVLVEGLVCDQEGHPIPDAEVRGSIEDPLAGLPDCDEVFSVKTDADGRFEGRGVCEASELLLEVCAPRLVLVSTDGPPAGARLRRVPRGARDVRLVVQRAASVEGTVLRDANVPHGVMRIRLSYVDGSLTLERPMIVDSFRWNDLPEGEVHVELLLDATFCGPRVIHRVENVVLRANEVTEDPRLNPINLKGHFRTWRFTVVNTDGLPVRRTKVILEPPRADGDLEGFPRSVFTDDEGTLRVTTLNHLRCMRVRVGGFEPVEVAWSPTNGIISVR